MGESLHDRCQRLCGDNVQGCFVNDASQLTCLSDMLINKAYGLAALLEMIKDEDLPGSAAELIDESVGITDEIINWIKYLQVTRDLKRTIHTALESQDSNRSEPRYPFPPMLGEVIVLRVGCEEELREARLVNFSRHGLQFACEHKVPVGRPFVGELKAGQVDKHLTFKAVVKYFNEGLEHNVVGAAIEEVSNQSDLNFFRSVLEFIAATVERSRGNK